MKRKNKTSKLNRAAEGRRWASTLKRMKENLASLWASLEFFFDCHGLFLAQLFIVAFHIVITLLGTIALAILIKLLITL